MEVNFESGGKRNTEALETAVVHVFSEEAEAASATSVVYRSQV